MFKVLSIHPENPQYRLIKEVVDLLVNGGIIAYPTDSGYALGCALGNKKAMAVSYTHLTLPTNREV